MHKKWLLLYLIFSFINLSAASAHAADMLFQTHYVDISATNISVKLEIVPGPLIANNIWHEADIDQNESISAQEASQWAQALLKFVVINLDEESQDIVLDSVTWPKDVVALYSADEPIIIHFSANWSKDISGQHTATLNNFYQDKLSVHWFNLRATSRIGFETPRQNDGLLSIIFYKTETNPISGILQNWESGRPSIPWVVQSLGLENVAEQAASEANYSGSSTSILEGLIKTDSLSPVFIISALFISFLLGMLHALTPGHGKTIVAAYLVGTKGRWYHAMLLGLIVTIAHTGSVFLVGFITLFVSNSFFTPNTISLLEIFSGVIIILLGFTLLYRRFPALKEQLQYKSKTDEPYDTDGSAIESQNEKIKIKQEIKELSADHSHDPKQSGFVPRVSATENTAPAVHWRSLIALGVSGGLVPCPDAIAILLVAMTIQRISFGLSMILTFSAGLAIVLIVIGLLIVQGKHLFKRLHFLDNIGIWMPSISAVIVLFIGILIVRSSLIANTNNAPSTNAIPQQTPTVVDTTAFNIANADILFTARDAQFKDQLFRYAISQSTLEQLTNSDVSIWDYSISPDNQYILYIIPDSENGSIFVKKDLRTNTSETFFTCEAAYCSNIEWFPNGEYFLYSRLSNKTNDSLGLSSIWWFDTNNFKTEPLFDNENMPGYNQKISPNGKWLSYATINPQQIRLFEFESGENINILSESGSEVIWKPDSKSIYIIDTYQFGEYYLPKLFLFDIETQEKELLSDQFDYDESLGSFSPTGKWIAVNRRDWSVTSGYSGNQIWLISSDGKKEHVVTNRKDCYYSQAQWSPDGRYLLYYISPLGENKDAVGIYFFDTETNQEHQLTTSGNRPAWLPDANN
jgi:nickel/cobalt transporter (NicO) family protein